MAIKVSSISSCPEMGARVTLVLDAKEQWLISKLRKAWYEDQEIEILFVEQTPRGALLKGIIDDTSGAGSSSG